MATKPKVAPEPKRIEMQRRGMTNANPLEDAVPAWEAAGWSRVDAQSAKDDGK